MGTIRRITKDKHYPYLKTLCYHNKLKRLSILQRFVPTFKTRRFFLQRLLRLHLLNDMHFLLSN